MEMSENMCVCVCVCFGTHNANCLTEPYSKGDHKKCKHTVLILLPMYSDSFFKWSVQNVIKWWLLFLINCLHLCVLWSVRVMFISYISLTSLSSILKLFLFCVFFFLTKWVISSVPTLSIRTTEFMNSTVCWKHAANQTITKTMPLHL